MRHSRAWTLALLTLAAFSASNARAEDGSTDETLKRLFPDRDLTKAAIKIVDKQKGCYIVGDTLQINKDGSVQMTNAVVIQVIKNGPNKPDAYLSHEASRALMRFRTPIKMASDLAGNALTSFVPEK